MAKPYGWSNDRAAGGMQTAFQPLDEENRQKPDGRCTLLVKSFPALGIPSPEIAL